MGKEKQRKREKTRPEVRVAAYTHAQNPEAISSI